MEWIAGHISTILSVLFGGGFIWSVVYYRPRKRKEIAEAKKAEIENTVVINEEFRKQLDYALEKLEEMETFKSKTVKKQAGQSRIITTLIAMIQRNDPFYCKTISCEHRDPALGSHKTILPEWMRKVLDNDHTA